MKICRKRAILGKFPQTHQPSGKMGASDEDEEERRPNGSARPETRHATPGCVRRAELSFAARGRARSTVALTSRPRRPVSDVARIHPRLENARLVPGPRQKLASVTGDSGTA